MGNLRLSEVTPAIITVHPDILAQNHAPATVKRYLAARSHAFSVLVREWQWMKDNAFLRVSKATEPRGASGGGWHGGLGGRAGLAALLRSRRTYCVAHGSVWSEGQGALTSPGGAAVESPGAGERRSVRNHDCHRGPGLVSPGWLRCGIPLKTAVTKRIQRHTALRERKPDNPCSVCTRGSSAGPSLAGDACSVGVWCGCRAVKGHSNSAVPSLSCTKYCTMQSPSDPVQVKRVDGIARPCVSVMVSLYLTTLYPYNHSR